MGIFRNKDQYEGYNIYSMKKYVDKKRITFIVIAIVAIIITLSMSIYYLVDTTKRVEKSKEFAKQIIEYNQQQQEEAKQKEIEKQAKIPKLTEQGKENIKNIYHTDKKVAYLTFDDGPSNNTHQILDILKQNSIKATFFVLGSQVEIFPETTLPMNDEDRKFKYGQFGYGKYLYNKEDLTDMKEFFMENLKSIFPNSIVKYII